MNGDLPPVDPEEQELIDHLRNAALMDLVEAERNRQDDSNLPVGTRQILKIKKHVLLSANWRNNSTDTQGRAQPYILMTGVPSPNSEVVKAYIRFVDAAELRAPYYSKVQKRIDLFVDIQSLPMVLVQLEHCHRYIWIGHFAGGHIYGDLHTSP